MLVGCEDILGMGDDRFLSIDDCLTQNFEYTPKSSSGSTEN
jgi:hypothetical protein